MELLAEIEHLNVEPAAEVVRRRSPSPEVIACIPFFYDQWKRSAINRPKAQGKRKEKNLDDFIAESGCGSYAELRAKERKAANAAPGAALPSHCITEKYQRRSISNAFTKLKKKQLSQQPG